MEASRPSRRVGGDLAAVALGRGVQHNRGEDRQARHIFGIGERAGLDPQTVVDGREMMLFKNQHGQAVAAA